VLYDGVPDQRDIARIVRNAPLQEAGRFTRRDLALSRMDKSLRLFQQAVEALRTEGQPELTKIQETGYLMRTTAVYGNGNFGIDDWDHIASRPGLSGPFMAEMLTVWMIRGFTHDLTEHIGGAPLDRRVKRQLGIKNATGLGTASFLVRRVTAHLVEWSVPDPEAMARIEGAQARLA